MLWGGVRFNWRIPCGRGGSHVVGKGGDVAHTGGWPSAERLSCYQLLSDDILDIKLMLWYYGKMNAD